MDECRLTFAAGGWVAVVILAQAVIDSEIAEGRADGLALNEIRFGREYIWLRNRRNSYLHNDAESPTLTVADLEKDAAALEREARRAVELMAGALRDM